MSKPKLAALAGELVPAEGASTPAVRIGRLTTAKACSVELARLYRASRKGHVDPQVAARLAYVMGALINSLKVSSLEERLDRLEAASANQRLPKAEDETLHGSSAPQGKSAQDAADEAAAAEARAADEAIIGAPEQPTD